MKHRYQRWLIKASLVHISTGIFLGFYMYLAPIIENPARLTNIRTVHVHLILAGGVMQMIMGVALWMFPRHKKAPHYTPAWQGMLLFIIFNAGMLLRSIFELWSHAMPEFYYFSLTGAILQVIALIFFGWLIMGRIRSP